ncbi:MULTISPECIES: hypothetical protein [Niastella]|uniref:Lipoprotein n=1 Tax=Niastella soli TaxID=2821487 RepID=A0ABS3YZH3_9BACT|nr:hypothetical protein [Niastella soli]MBO9202795.1 hypothetical protein [Niastella soli]
MTRALIFVALSAVLCCASACGSKRTLLVKNVTERYDSIPVRVTINNRIVFNETVLKTKVSFDYYEREFSAGEDSICVDVELPTLKVRKQSCAEAAQGKLIVLSINETGNVPKISIAFFKKKFDEVY